MSILNLARTILERIERRFHRLGGFTLISVSSVSSKVIGVSLKIRVIRVFRYGALIGASDILQRKSSLKWHAKRLIGWRESSELLAIPTTLASLPMTYIKWEKLNSSSVFRTTSVGRPSEVSQPDRHRGSGQIRRLYYPGQMIYASLRSPVRGYR